MNNYAHRRHSPANHLDLVSDPPLALNVFSGRRPDFKGRARAYSDEGFSLPRFNQGQLDSMPHCLGSSEFRSLWTCAGVAI